MTEDWKNQPEPSKASAVLWRHKDGGLRTYTCAGALWYPTGSSYGRPRVVVWQTGDPFDKLRPYANREGVEARAERDGTVVVGPLKRVYTGMVEVGALTLAAPRWTVTVTAPKSMAPWWAIGQIEEGHVVSWAEGPEAISHVLFWERASDLDQWRTNWDEFADPATWRVTDVHAAGGPKLIAWNATAEDELATGGLA